MKKVKNILICGAGMMGKNIGFVFASNPDFQVGMYDLYPTDVEAGIRTNTKQLVDKGVLTEEELADRLSRIPALPHLLHQRHRQRYRQERRLRHRGRVRGHEDQA